MRLWIRGNVVFNEEHQNRKCPLRNLKPLTLKCLPFSPSTLFTHLTKIFLIIIIISHSYIQKHERAIVCFGLKLCACVSVLACKYQCVNICGARPASSRISNLLLNCVAEKTLYAEYQQSVCVCARTDQGLSVELARFTSTSIQAPSKSKTSLTLSNIRDSAILEISFLLSTFQSVLEQTDDNVFFSPKNII